MNRRTGAWAWGWRGFVGCMAGYALPFVFYSLQTKWAVSVFFGLICVLPGLLWGACLRSVKLAVCAAVVHAGVIVALSFRPLSGEALFFYNALFGSTNVPLAIELGLILGLSWYGTGFGLGALLGVMVAEKGLWAMGGAIGARVGLFVPLTAWGIAALAGQLSPGTLWKTETAVVPLTLIVGLTLFAAAKGRRQAAMGQANA